VSKEIRDSERSSAALALVVVYGASGHTGRFVLSELQRRGRKIVAAGRDSRKLQMLAETQADLEIRAASIDNPKSLDEALAGAVAVINCAGPFLDTAAPLMSAALRARIHYLDVAAEQAATLAAFEQFSEPARDAGVVVLPSMAFYGGLGDLLATATMDDWSQADEIRVAVGLDSWKPTRGTRRTGERNTYRRRTFSKSKLEFLADPEPKARWNFPEPFGTQEVVALPLAETIVISRHLRVPEVVAYMNLIPLEDLRDPNTPEPTAVDESGRSAQKFVMDVIVRRGEVSRRTTARGQDIYAITAPLVVEALERISSSRKKVSGTVAPGEIFDARDFLKALAPSHLEVDFLGSTSPAAEHTK
jgi:hypothetical protein